MKNAIKVDPQYFNALSRIFTPLVLDDIAHNGYSKFLSEVCSNSGLTERLDYELPLSIFFNKIYNLLCSHYRNEYVYKNIIVDQILTKMHAIELSKMLTEFRVGRSRADVVILNGTSTVYEIKTEYDSFKRLNDQLNAYLQVFDHVNVVTSTKLATHLHDSIPGHVGLLCIKADNSISTLKTSMSNKQNIKPEILFDSLRKPEYLQVIQQLFGTIPNAPNTLIYKECKNLITIADPATLHDITMNVLRERNDTKAISTFLEKAPRSLFAYIISNAHKKIKLQALTGRFNTTIGKILAPT